MIRRKITDLSVYCRLAKAAGKRIFAVDVDFDICVNKCPSKCSFVAPSLKKRSETEEKFRMEDAAKSSVYRNNRRARIAKSGGKYTAQDVSDMRKIQEDRCAICSIDLGGRGHIDHIFPLARGGTNWPHNLQILCQSCNLRKSDKDPIEFLFPAKPLDEQSDAS